MAPFGSEGSEHASISIVIKSVILQLDASHGALFETGPENPSFVIQHTRKIQRWQPSQFKNSIPDVEMDVTFTALAQHRGFSAGLTMTEFPPSYEKTGLDVVQCNHLTRHYLSCSSEPLTGAPTPQNSLWGSLTGAWREWLGFWSGLNSVQPVSYSHLYPIIHREMSVGSFVRIRETRASQHASPHQRHMLAAKGADSTIRS